MWPTPKLMRQLVRLPELPNLITAFASGAYWPATGGDSTRYNHPVLMFTWLLSLLVQIGIALTNTASKTGLIIKFAPFDESIVYLPGRAPSRIRSGKFIAPLRSDKCSRWLELPRSTLTYCPLRSPSPRPAGVVQRDWLHPGCSRSSAITWLGLAAYW